MAPVSCVGSEACSVCEGAEEGLGAGVAAECSIERPSHAFHPDVPSVFSAELPTWHLVPDIPGRSLVTALG